MVTRVRNKGQITIPRALREELGFTVDTSLRISKIGDGIFLTKSPSKIDEYANKFSDYAKKNGITLESVLAELRAIRKGKSAKS